MLGIWIVITIVLLWLARTAFSLHIIEGLNDKNVSALLKN